jgi:hypothetical protein
VSACVVDHLVDCIMYLSICSCGTSWSWLLSLFVYLPKLAGSAVPIHEGRMGIRPRWTERQLCAQQCFHGRCIAEHSPIPIGTQRSHMREHPCTWFC